MSGTTVAEGVVIVSADAKNIPKDIARDVEKGGSELQSTGDRAGSKLFGGLRKVAIGAVATVGLVGAAVGGLAIKGGFDRALSIQDATKKLEGLGHDTQAVSSIMASALNSVRGTAFGLGAAATTSASLVAAGVGLGGELERRLKTVADTATIAGRSMEDVGTIFGSVAAKGKLQGDDLLQLMSSGVPVLQFLAKHLGITSEEVSKMVTAGKIDFATFADAMEEGIGGAALRGGETARGAFANVMAALGRMGAAFATPVVEGIPGVFSAISGAIDGVSAALKPVSDAFGAWLTPNLEAFSGWLDGVDFEKLIKGIGELSPIANVFKLFESYAPVIAVWGKELWPTLSRAFEDIADALAPVLPMIGKELADAVVELAPSMIELLEAVIPIVPALVDLAVLALPPLLDILELVVPVLSDFIGLMADLLDPVSEILDTMAGDTSFAELGQGVLDATGPVGDLGRAFEDFYNNIYMPVSTGILTAFGLIAGVSEGVVRAVADGWNWLGNNVFAPVGSFIGAVLTNMGAIFQAVYQVHIKPAIDGVAKAFQWVYSTIIAPVANAINGSVKGVGTTVRNTFSPIAGWVGSAFSGALNLARGPINGLISLVNGAIRGLNGLSVKIPDWVPAVGGQSWGMNLPTIPMLAKGGVTRTGGTVMVGERGPEYLNLPAGAQVTPLNRPDALPRGGDAPFVGGDLIIYEASDPLGSAGRLEASMRKYRKTR